MIIMPFDFHVYEKLRRAAGRLKEDRWSTVTEIKSFKMAEDDGEVGAAPVCGDGEMKLYDRWSGYNKYIWLDTVVKVPENIEGDIWGRFEFGITGGGGNSGFESLMYLNGEPWQGVDQNHSDVPLNAKAGDTLHLQFRLWSGMNGGGFPQEREHRINRAEIAVLDNNTDKLYYLMNTLLDMYTVLDENDPEKERMLDIAECAWDYVDTFSGKEELVKSAQKAVEYIESKLSDEDKKVIVDAVGHTHIDTAWLWKLDNTREKCARSFSTVNRLMERYPEYTFMHTQAQQYDYVKHDYPKVYENIRKRAKEGRWEPAGGMWVECDCNLPSGESLARQVLYGTRFFEEEFGNKSTFLWLPDVFGYSAALPQILKKSEIDTFITTKISWNDQNRVPYDTFVWKGIDGTDVLAHFITTPEISGDPRFYTYNGEPCAKSTLGIWKNYRNKSMNRELLMCYGFGDGGGGPTRDMLERIRCLESMPSIPKIKTGRVDDYCKKLHETFEKNENKSFVPVWDGELYLEFHRGTYTSQAYNKKTNRRMEFLLRRAELAVTQAYINGKDVSKEREILNKSWKTVLCLQFHDIIPGSSIREVYEDCRKMYAEVENDLNGVIKSMCDEESKGLYIWNTANWDRDSVITVYGDFKGKHLEANGKALTQHVYDDRAVLFMPKLAAMAQTELYIKDGAVSEEKCAVIDANSAETELLKLVWDNTGKLVSIYDKEAERELVPDSKAANEISVYEDRPREYDAWELEYTHKRKGYTLSMSECSVLENNAVRAVIEFKYSFGKSSMVQRMTVYAHTKRIDFVTKVDWNDREVLLKTAFPTNIRSSRARFDIQYGSVERSTTKNTSWEIAKFETVGHKWADLSESGYGAALMSDSKYGYDIHDGVLSLSLLKSSNYPDYTADMGVQEFTYSFFPHTGEWYDAKIDNESWEINEAPVVMNCKLPENAVVSSNENITVSAVKLCENSDEIIVRLHEKEGRHSKAKLNVLYDVEYWNECNILERCDGEKNTGNVINLPLNPFEIKTIKIKLKK